MRSALNRRVKQLSLQLLFLSFSFFYFLSVFRYHAPSSFSPHFNLRQSSERTENGIGAVKASREKLETEGNEKNGAIGDQQ